MSCPRSTQSPLRHGRVNQRNPELPEVGISGTLLRARFGETNARRAAQSCAGERSRGRGQRPDARGLAARPSLSQDLPVLVGRSSRRRASHFQPYLLGETPAGTPAGTPLKTSQTTPFPAEVLPTGTPRLPRLFTVRLFRHLSLVAGICSFLRGIWL